MHKVKTIKKGAYTLNHSWYLDDFGIKTNSFELIKMEDDGQKVLMPFWGMLRVNKDKGTYFGEDTSPYTDEEYEQMIDEQIKRFIR